MTYDNYDVKTSLDKRQMIGAATTWVVAKNASNKRNKSCNSKNDIMWWRILTFCILVCLILFIVLSCIHGRPVLHLFFHRCCEENIENDQVLFENFGNNFLRERLIGDDKYDNNGSLVSDEDIEEVLILMKDKLNVHDPKFRVNLTVIDDGKQAENFLKVTQNETDIDIEKEDDDDLDETNTGFNKISFITTSSPIENDTALENTNDEIIKPSDIKNLENAMLTLDSDDKVEVTTKRTENTTKPIILIK